MRSTSTAPGDDNVVGMTTPRTAPAGPEKKSSSILSIWKEKLITGEDAYHNHKILGILALLSMALRFAMVGQQTDMGFASHPEWTWPTLALHFALTLSSFQFKIPPKRIRDGGRIWPQYRLHAACFAIRSMLCIALYHLERQHNWEPNFNLNFIILMGGMLAADLSTWSVGTQYQSRSVRDLDTHPAVKFFFSFIQFNTSAGVLYGLRRFSLHFLVIFVTQTTPFVATLRRKNLFTSNGAGAALYGFMLLLSAAIVQMDYYHAGGKTFVVVRTVGQLAALQRMTPLPDGPHLFGVFRPSFFQNKYVVWTCMFLIVRYLRQPHIMDEVPVEYFKLAWAATFFMCVVLGYYKTQLSLNHETGRKVVKAV